MKNNLAFLFPGQGSQSVGMLADLAIQFPQIKATFSEASEVLDYDLWALVSTGPETDLNQTDRTQPAMLVAGIATWRVWQAQSDVMPAYFAGHSLGEYTALVAAGALDFSDAIELVADRGRYMQAAVPAGEGAMAAILGLEDEAVIALCAKSATQGIVEAVNFNSPGQVVIAGSRDAVNAAITLATEQGAKRALLLPVSVPSHCALMAPAAAQLTERLANIELTSPTTPVIHNVIAQTTSDITIIRELLAGQVQSPVQWVESVQYMAAQGVDTLIECGPGKVLAGLTKRIDKTLTTLPIFDTASLEKAVLAIGE
jgi:[acyl-carrier-protein] S-malonyltransferase